MDLNTLFDDVDFDDEFDFDDDDTLVMSRRRPHDEDTDIVDDEEFAKAVDRHMRGLPL